MHRREPIIPLDFPAPSHACHNIPTVHRGCGASCVHELNRYRNLYVEMMELLKVTKKTFEARARTFAGKVSVSLHAQAFCFLCFIFLQLYVFKEKMFGEKLKKKMEAKELGAQTFGVSIPIIFFAIFTLFFHP